MSKKLLFKTLIIIGIVPFAFAVVTGIYASVTGFAGVAITSPPQYGFDAFIEWIFLYSYIFWPTYLAGAVSIVAAIVIKIKFR